MKHHWFKKWILSVAHEELVWPSRGHLLPAAGQVEGAEDRAGQDLCRGRQEAEAEHHRRAAEQGDARPGGLPESEAEDVQRDWARGR